MAKKASKDKKIRIALNGLGRVGRVFLRMAYDNPYFEIVAAKSRSPLETYVHLLKYDSAYGVWDREVSKKRSNLVIGGNSIPFIQQDNGVDWKKYGVDMLLDATGKYTKREKAEEHIQAGAKFVVASAPMKEEDITLVYGINHKSFDPEKHRIVSAGSCTTVCSTLTAKVLEENFGIKQGFINTVHAVTNDQQLLDASHKDLRRARSATQSIIPTSTGVSKTLTKLYPHLAGKISALSLRVPVLNPSVVVFTVELKKKTTTQALNSAFKKAASGQLKNHLAVSELPLVSTDFKGNPHGAIIDLYSTEVVNGHLANVLAWYDNEWGYVRQMVYLLEHMAKQIVK
ncbi:MAG: type I glyceraldehyde-3-phosphate dehydrogenase [Candidatus Doudnabacteria bacterium CG10_big_fil_rev_8_21_14_0_10_42_18]|uniref:Type I glyceraldehyde-3-phosphate dehydrogenase n=1 Tax=Candidatus Doudnabacteria bacterium CG10_big_fil_rev_8_21_14_0_10_42_18 TaxID=1974552 RepID=A0A2H0VAD5_9BACT|nr:MAG: type I glyceraldehyde-3-phosphate dehydrogenase [Candidatus Doudnabacteria bacterium CG10_big_fil_rev_8_21_14_0_10_42_18]